MAKINPHKISALDKTSREQFSSMLANRGLWSEKIVKETLNRSGGHPFNVEDVQTIVKDYLGVLSDTIERGEDV